MSEQVEQVLVFPESVFQEIGFFTGVSRKDAAEEFLKNPKLLASLSYRPRPDMEKDPSFKQIIPYCVIQLQLSGGQKYFFAYERTKKGGEQRLHNLFSVGVGGHINPCDGETGVEFSETLEKGMLRELSEELKIKGDFDTETLGLIYDDSNDVGKVHLGVVLLIKLKEGASIKTNDPSLDKGTLVTYNWLKENSELLENWSKLVVKELL
jgi:predicted NUDIX family phosphoesterase